MGDVGALPAAACACARMACLTVQCSLTTNTFDMHTPPTPSLLSQPFPADLPKLESALEAAKSEVAAEVPKLATNKAHAAAVGALR